MEESLEEITSKTPTPMNSPLHHQTNSFGSARCIGSPFFTAKHKHRQKLLNCRSGPSVLHMLSTGPSMRRRKSEALKAEVRLVRSTAWPTRFSYLA